MYCTKWSFWISIHEIVTKIVTEIQHIELADRDQSMNIVNNIIWVKTHTNIKILTKINYNIDQFYLFLFMKNKTERKKTFKK